MFLKKISDNLNFQNILTCSDADVRVILEIRNEEKIRNNMFNSKIISLEEHLLWKKNFLESNTDRFYCIKYKNIIVGGLGLKNYNIKNLSADWAFYVAESRNFIGLGASIENKALNYFFDNYKIKNIFCYVLISNAAVINLHKKFGFKKINMDSNFEDNFLNVKKKDVLRMKLSKFEWIANKSSIYNKFFKK
jgi:UDP-4-amino-4,6-dideoxy-N-acetyl-beta-L-altrosamine N-acetyltransferase